MQPLGYGFCRPALFYRHEHDLQVLNPKPYTLVLAIGTALVAEWIHFTLFGIISPAI